MIHGLDTSFLVAVEVSSHKEHASARSRLQKLLKAQDAFALAPQILAEFIHVEDEVSALIGLPSTAHRPC